MFIVATCSGPRDCAARLGKDLADERVHDLSLTNKLEPQRIVVTDREDLTRTAEILGTRWREFAGSVLGRTSLDKAEGSSKKVSIDRATIQVPFLAEIVCRESYNEN